MQLDEKDVLGEKPKRRKSVRMPSVVKKEEELTDDSVIHEEAQVPTFPEKENHWLSRLEQYLRWAFFGLAFLLPIFFLPITTDILELNKQTLIFVGTFALTAISVLRWMCAKQCEIKVTPVYIGIAAWLATWLAASIFSIYPYQSFVGIEKQEFMSFSTLLALTLFAFFSIQFLTKRDVITASYAFLASTLIASLFNVLQLFGVFLLPWDFTKQPSFGLIGQYDLWGSVVASALVLSVAHIIRLSLDEKNKKQSIALAVFSALCLIVLLLLDDWRLWFSATLGLLVIAIFVASRAPRDAKMTWLFFPSFLIVFSLLMIFVPLPRFINLPLTVQPTWGTSASIALQSISEKPLLGFGPGNFFSQYTQFRPKEINKANYLKLWTLRFDQSSSHVLTVLASVGILGILGILGFALLFLISVFRYLLREHLHDEYMLVLGFFGAVVAIRALALLKPSNMTLVFLFWFAVTCILAIIIKRTRVIELKNSGPFLFGASFTFWGFIALGCIGGFFLVQRYQAEFAFANALKIDRELSVLNQNQQATTPDKLDALVSQLAKAISKNPYHHTYPRTLSQALSYKLSYVLKNTDPSKQNEVLGTIQALTSSAIDAAKQAVALHPKDVRNISNLATLYEGIASLAAGAEAFAAEHYKKAVALDPTNPENYLAFGKYYLSMLALHTQRATESKDEAQKTNETQEAKKNLPLALEQFNTALKLKNDYASANYYKALIDIQNNQNSEALSNLGLAMNANLSMEKMQAADDTLFYSIGVGYLTINEKSRAMDAFKKALDLNANYALAAWQYALLSSEKDETRSNAIAILEGLLKSDPSNETIKQKLQELQTGKKETKEEKTQE